MKAINLKYKNGNYLCLKTVWVRFIFFTGTHFSTQVLVKIVILHKRSE